MINYSKLAHLTDSGHFGGVHHKAANASQPMQILFIF